MSDKGLKGLAREARGIANIFERIERGESNVVKSLAELDTGSKLVLRSGATFRMMSRTIKTYDRKHDGIRLELCREGGSNVLEVNLKQVGTRWIPVETRDVLNIIHIFSF